MPTTISGTTGINLVQDGVVGLSTLASNSVNQAKVGTNTLAGTGPAFSAYENANQTGITNNTWTKITYDTEEFDTNNNFASSRFTPTVAGYYQVNATVSFNAATTNPTFCRAAIYKNGTQYKSTYIPGSTIDRVIPCISSVIYFNGSTDYVEVYGLMLGSTGGLFDGNGFSTFSGAMVRSA